MAAASGCSLLGLGMPPAPAGPGGGANPNAGDFRSVEPGARLIVQRRDGTRLEGFYLGLESRAPDTTATAGTPPSQRVRLDVAGHATALDTADIARWEVTDGAPKHQRWVVLGLIVDVLVLVALGATWGSISG